MIQSLYSGAAGLRAHQTQMDVIGDNIANVNTIGFKASRAEFKEALSQTIRGAGSGTNPSQVGLGVNVGSISANQSQGALQSTGRSLDLAIEGGGFLTLSDGKSQFYTRDGSLNVDSTGALVTGGSVGFRVMGWNADAYGKVDSSSGLSEIHLPVGQASVARQTSQVSFAGNLDSSTAANGTVNTSYKVYDSLGQSHTLAVTFTKTATPGEWTWKASSPDGSFGTPDTGSGTVTFDSNGKLATGGGGSPALTLTSPNGASATVGFKLDMSSITALAGSGQSSVAPASQDGLPPGTLSNYSIDSNGIVTGTFSNGMTQAIAQVALSDFTNPDGLNKMGGNVFGASANSGLAQVGVPASGGRGKITAGFLEMSNVDLSTEFTNMIVAQRGFQANSKVITTSDEMLQDLIGLKR